VEAFGWYVIEIDGYNIESITDATSQALSRNHQPPNGHIAHNLTRARADFTEHNQMVWYATECRVS